MGSITGSFSSNMRRGYSDAVSSYIIRVFKKAVSSNTGCYLIFSEMGLLHGLYCSVLLQLVLDIDLCEALPPDEE